MRQKKKAILTAIIISIFIAIACSASETMAEATTPSATTPTPDKSGGVLTIISHYLPTAWGYPSDHVGFGDAIAVQPCLESLTDHSRDGKQMFPMLATDWDIDPDNLTLTYHLRKGVKFHDGTDFNAEVAKWNLEKYIERGRGIATKWTSIDVIDNYTVRINLKEFANTQISGIDTIYMASPTAVQKNGVDWAKTHPVGTGPFKFKSFSRDVSLEYERFDDYWRGKPYLDGIKYRYIADATTALMAFKAGEAQVLEEAPEKTAADLVARGFNNINRRGPGMILIPDAADPNSIFADKKVREALEYAIDREAIAKTLGYGFWEAQYQLNVPEQFSHIPDLEVRSYDPEKAKELLKEAGYPNGFQTTIHAAQPFSGDQVVAVQSYLSEVGINAKIDVVGMPQFQEFRYKGWDDLLFSFQGTEDFNYCAYLERYYTKASGYYPDMLKPAGWEDLMHQALTATDFKTQIELSQKAVRWHFDEVMAIPLWARAAIYVLNPTVHDTGYATHGSGFRWSPYETWLSKK